MTQEALKLALEVLEYWDVHGKLHQPTEEAITAIKEALALQALHDENERLGLYKDAYAQPEQEPVATVTSETGADITMSWWHEPALPIGTKLYTTPPQRTWVGLTDEEWLSLGCKSAEEVRIGLAIQAKLKERNT
jgi:ferric-dicitrate binding protein FerR (iron transport regulator)